MAEIEYVDVHRRFSQIEPDERLSAEAWQGLTHGYYNGLGWAELLERPRVVVLADAAAGKSEEFRARVRDLRKDEQAAFYVTVESLHGYGLDGSLGRTESQQFEAWKQGSATGWFFVDSVDEARLNHKNVEQALKRLARDLGQGYDRAHILISCRGNVWAGRPDLELVRQTLEVPERKPAELPPVDPDEALLVIPSRPLFSEEDAKTIPDVTVVALTKLSDTQRAAFLTAADVDNIEDFEKSLYARGLWPLAERPGDLITLIKYWKANQRFGSLTDMLELGIRERLAERGEARRTISNLSDDALRRGAERLAASLVLGRSMNLSRPSELPSPSEAIDPRAVLGDWAPAEVDQLLDRGLFVPSTFGLVKFYHRSAQEYLAACWFRRMGERLTDPELSRIFLADALGIRTVPPSLRATAAWLAQWRPNLRRHLLEREPLVLLEHGDPAQLTLTEKESLLATYAARDAAGDIAYTRIDHQSLWMFAQAELSAAIDAAVADNPRENFRYEMLRLIEAGEITGCVEVARAGALEPATRQYHRIVATRILRRLNDDEGLKAAAANVVATADTLGPELAPTLVTLLFPDYLSVSDCLTVIAKSKPAREFHTEGFRDELVVLFDACRTQTDRVALIAGLADLGLTPPLEDWPPVSRRHLRLARRLGPIARRAVIDSDRNDYGCALLRLLMVVERSGASKADTEETPSLQELLLARPALRQSFFWASIRQAIAAATPDKPVRSWRDARVGERDLWALVPEDTTWLEVALRRDHESERHVALSALITLARALERTELEFDRLAKLVAHDAPLSKHLAKARVPYVDTAEDKARAERYAQSVRKREQRKAEEDQFWRDLRDRLKADPKRLRDPEVLRVWPGPKDLRDLTDWLSSRVKSGRGEGARQWPKLIDAFGREVAEAYRDGMKALWRVTKPERPKYRKDGQRTVKYTIITSIAGLNLEAAELDWAKALSSDEARLALLHASIDDQGTQTWIADLLVCHPDIAVAPIVAQMRREWKRGETYHPLLDQAAHGLPFPPALRAELMKLIRSVTSSSPEMIKVSKRILERMDLTRGERAGLAKLFDRRVAQDRRGDSWDAMVHGLGTLFLVDQTLASTRLLEVLAGERRRRHQSRAYGLLVYLFGRHQGIVGRLEELSPGILGEIILEAYRQEHRSPCHDDPEPSFDRFNEAGGSALNALISQDGQEAYYRMLWLSRQPEVGERGHRLRELAYEMAERNSERPAWAPARLKAFEHKMLAPIGNADDLMSLTLELIDAINDSFARADMSPRAVVETANSERAVQEWLGDALSLRADGRFHVQRESQVADDNRPDLILSSASSADQLPIEIKHGNMNWSLAALRKALRSQLAQQYLLPANRRRGVLVISHHRETRFWRDEKKRRRISFEEMIALLQAEAQAITENEAGSIKVAVRGINAAKKASADA